NIVIKLKDAYPNNNFECYTDNSPIYEVSAAVNAGLGFKGKNNLLVTKEYGSFVFIGEIITDKKFDFDEKCNYSCLNCNKCVLNCKSSALKTKSYLLCNSYLTQKKGELLDFEKKIIKDGKYIWGCDDCQDCCPYNQNLKQVDFDEKLVCRLELSELSRLSNKEFLDKYHNSAFIYRGKNIIIRNISIKNNLF
ncbi:MAG: 4Fe-4S double cluster binding domain-containing protein, partial [Clostridia bacterium]